MTKRGSLAAAVWSSSFALLLAGCAQVREVDAKAQPQLPATIGIDNSKAPLQSRRVLVVINRNSQDSIDIGSYYAAKRQIPSGNVVIIDSPPEEDIDWKPFEAQVRDPIRAALKKSKNLIDFIVTTKGVPLRIKPELYSVDAHLAAMDLDIAPMGQPDIASYRRCLSPYFNKDVRFSHKRFGLYLVTRLDGFTVKDAKRLVDDSLAARPEKGPFFFDAAGNRKDGSYGPMQQLLFDAGQILKIKGFDSKVDQSDDFISPDEPLAGYASWGSNDGRFQMSLYQKLRFKPGAIAETFVSTSARTFKPVVGGQSLIGDLIAGGITGVKGYVSEPYTIALAKPDILFDRYTKGYNLAESFYMASPLVKWKDVIIGDPLCAPYRK